MKKSQRLRFHALVAKQATGAILTDAELAEFRALAALAATHPRAADDTDDETEEEKKKREEKEAAEKKGEDEETEEEKKKKDEQAKGRAASPGISARLQAAMAGLAGSAPAQAAAELKKARKDLAQAQSDLATAKASLKSTETSLAALCDFLGFKPADIAGKTQADIDAICTAKIGAAATAQIASIGLNPGRLPAPSGKTSPDSKTLTKAEFDALTPKEKMEFSVKGGRLVD